MGNFNFQTPSWNHTPDYMKSDHEESNFQTPAWNQKFNHLKGNPPQWSIDHGGAWNTPSPFLIGKTSKKKNKQKSKKKSK